MTNIINTEISKEIKERIEINLDFELDDIELEDKICIGVNMNNSMYRVILFFKKYRLEMGEVRYHYIKYEEYHKTIIKDFLVCDRYIRREVENNIRLNKFNETKIQKLDYDFEMNRLKNDFLGE